MKYVISLRSIPDGCSKENGESEEGEESEEEDPCDGFTTLMGDLECIQADDEDQKMTIEMLEQSMCPEITSMREKDCL